MSLFGWSLNIFMIIRMWWISGSYSKMRSLVRVVLLHEVVEQDMAVGKFDPRSLVEPYIRIVRRSFLLWTLVKWEPWMVKRVLIGVIKGMSVVVL